MAVTLAVLAILAAEGCTDLCRYDIVLREASPMMRYVAVMFGRVYGPTAGTTVNVSVLPQGRDEQVNRSGILGGPQLGDVRAATTWPGPRVSLQAEVPTPPG